MPIEIVVVLKSRTNAGDYSSSNSTDCVGTLLQVIINMKEIIIRLSLADGVGGDLQRFGCTISHLHPMAAWNGCLAWGLCLHF